MADNDRITNTIYKAVEEVNEQLHKNRRLEKNLETVLFGRGGKLDSLGLVSLIAAVEQNIDEEFGVAITLADERAMSQENSPFRTLSSLKDYARLLLKESTGA